MNDLHFAYGYILLILIPIGALLVWYRLRYYKKISFTYPLTRTIAKTHKAHMFHEKFFFLLRLVTLLILSLLIAKPQLVDNSTKVHVDGVDIVLVLDVSGSMLYFDDPQDPQSRIEIAKNEALRFVEKRESDPMGIVLFGKEAVSRCPLTLDKRIIKDIINGVFIGMVPENGTVLAKGLIIAASRLKNSKAKSKIMILLTDGEPSQEDCPADQAIQIARQLGIRVYTIGVGGFHGGFLNHPQLGLIPGGSNLNRELLQKIAQKTGGRYFEAKKQFELRSIYDQIDQLEKTEYESTIFSSYHDIFIPFIWLLISILFIELVCSTFIWFAL